MFADPRLDEGLHSIVDKDVTAEEKELSKQQKTLGAIAHLTLQGMEGYSCLYKRLNDLVLKEKWLNLKPSLSSSQQGEAKLGL